LTHIRNSENASKRTTTIRPGSKLMGEILRVMQQKGYIVRFTQKQDGRGIYYEVELNGHINQVAAIKPRYAVGKNEFEKFEKRFLPARDIGMIIVSTSQGVMTHQESKEKAIGGRLLAYMY
jgi:small subunit ribosomal protein S8